MACTQVILLLAILLIFPMINLGSFSRDLFLTVAEGGAAVVFAQLLVAVGQFGPGGFGAGSLGAKLSVAATTEGHFGRYGMAAVSTVQSFGAAGMAASQMVAVGGAVGAPVYGTAQSCGCNC